jgi:hypothetical protein
MYMCPILNSFQGRNISLYSSKIVDKKEMLHAVSNTSIYFSRDKVGTVACLYSVLYSEIALSRKPQ